MSYEPSKTETKWQDRWSADEVYRVDNDVGDRDAFYCLEMLPYPSGRLHMGHVRNYSLGDVLARYHRMNGRRVLHPMGWDSFGMPAENAAIERSIHPAVWTNQNIDVMRSQLQRLGFGYDWSREIATHTPEYYRWNQWFFLRLLERDLAYRAEGPVNWCPECETVLANEQVESGLCWRCDSVVEERKLSQWFFRITRYADELLDGIDDLTGWPERVRAMQRNWIGRSEGTRVDFPIVDRDERLAVFTTRVDTIFGATFVVLAPEHPFATGLLVDGPGPASEMDTEEFAAEVERLSRMRGRPRQGEEIEKIGVDTGHRARNPYSGEEIPVWIANFVLMEFGTGAVMAVPAHDQRDYEFARAYDLPIRPVVRPDADEVPAWVDDVEQLEEAFTDDGVLLDACGEWADLSSAAARAGMTEAAEEAGFGAAAIDYKLKDWGVSRQRYWGTPIPIVYCTECGTVPVPEDQLPVLLPEDIELTHESGSPLARCEEFVNTTCPECGGGARRETDTMDTFVDSSWYYLRYLSPDDGERPFDPAAAASWCPVDFYIGGITHAVLHLLYFRFFCKVLADLELMPVREPVAELLTQGMVLKGGSAMSKSKGNVVDPDEMVQQYGADATRLFTLFAAPPRRDFEWDEGGIEGCARFLNRSWTLVEHAVPHLEGSAAPAADDVELPEALARLRRKAHDTTRRVTEDIAERQNFNTAIAAMMELVNEAYAATSAVPVAEAGEHLWVYRDTLERLVLLLAPFAPHVAHELWEMLGHESHAADASWPSWDEEVLELERVSLAVQVDGKVRGRIEVPSDLTDEERLVERAREEPNVAQTLEGRSVARSVVVPGRIINLVTEG